VHAIQDVASQGHIYVLAFASLSLIRNPPGYKKGRLSFTTQL
jgi:hypothetical protein